MTDDLLLPSEIEEVLPEPRKRVSKEARWENFEKGYWTDARGKQTHISDMVTPWIENVLNTLWSQAVKEACDQDEDLILQLRETYGDVAADMELYSRPADAWADPEELWERHPFVIVALQALEYRHVAYTPPFERKLPF